MKLTIYQILVSTCSDRILAVHGWLDNSNSFAFLGPKLADAGYDVIALDLAGKLTSDLSIRFS